MNSANYFKQKIEDRGSSLLKQAVAFTGLLGRWEEHITQWPRVLLYHLVSSQGPSFLRETTIVKQRFHNHLSTLRRRYHFLSWPEYKEALTSPREAKRCVLLTFDDGFQQTWINLQELADDHKIPAVFFVNTRMLDNAYAPWTTQYYFLRSQADGKFLEPLWKSISKGVALSPEEARVRCHNQFSLSKVVEPLEEGLSMFGMTPTELAQQFGLYVASADLGRRSNLIEIGNHSHSHYILKKLNDSELENDLRSSHQALTTLLKAAPECFAYPFGIPQQHFDQRCLKALHAVSPYPYVFAATTRIPPSLNELGRVCLDNVRSQQVLGTAAQVAPRTFQDWLRSRSSVT